MSGKIISLRKNGPTQTQEEMSKMLECITEECRAGDVAGFYMVIDRGNGYWAERVSGCEGLRMLGILTVMRDQMLTSLLAE